MRGLKMFKRAIAFSLALSLSVPLTVNLFKSDSCIYANAETPNNLTISENGLQFIINREGFSSTCFWDYAQWTIGYGTRCTESNHPSNPSELQKGSHTISRDEAKSRFLKALENTYIPGVRNKLSGVNMNQNQFDALVSLCYNAGSGRLANSPFAKYLRGEITKTQAYNDYCSYVITAGGKVNQGLINRRKLEADLFFKDVPDDIVVTDGCFQPCGSGYTSIVDALNSIGADSSYENRKVIAAANGISGYSGTASQNTEMLNKLKEGTLKKPTGSEVTVPDVPVIVYPENYFPACSSSFSSIVDALKSIGIDSSMSNRKKIAEANGISGYSGTAEQNTQLLNLLKQGKLKNPDATISTPDTSGKYFPACNSSATSIVDALKSLNVDSSMNYRKQIAEKNGISGYSGTAAQNTQMLSMLKSGMLIRPEYVEPPAIVDYTVNFNANGGTTPITSMTIASNSTYNGLPTASRNGYTFEGWYTSADGGAKVNDGASLVTSSNHTLYAHWTANQYTISFDNNDGSGITTTKKVTYGGNYGELPVPVRKGYTFTGWYTTYVDTDNKAITSANKYESADNQTLYAHWTADTYTISFDINGGSGSVDNISVEYDKSYGELPQVSRNGYEFDGWFTENIKGEQIFNSSIVNITKNQVLYAHWSKIKEELKLEKTEINLKNGEQYTVSANVPDVSFKSNNKDVAVVSQSGVVTAVGIGVAIISVVDSDYNVAQLKVTVTAVNAISGDCNNDGEISAADLVTLQKWLLGSGEIKNWKNADIYKDDRIDAFDLAMLRKMLIER